jgi:hypothetical protein
MPHRVRTRDHATLHAGRATMPLVERHAEIQTFRPSDVRMSYLRIDRCNNCPEDSKPNRSYTGTALRPE